MDLALTLTWRLVREGVISEADLHRLWACARPRSSSCPSTVSSPVIRPTSSSSIRRNVDRQPRDPVLQELQHPLPGPGDAGPRPPSLAGRRTAVLETGKSPCNLVPCPNGVCADGHGIFRRMGEGIPASRLLVTDTFVAKVRTAADVVPAHGGYFHRCRTFAEH